MKSKSYILSTLLAAAVFFSSCEKTEKPVIEEFELGYQNSKKATLGNDLHINAEVLAEAKISTIQVEIHTEEGHDGKGADQYYEGEGWEFDSIYTEFSGLKNTTFHKHVDIPVTADTGTYHFHFIVTDLEGNQTAIEDDLKIEQPEDTEAPVITVTQAPASGTVFSNGQTITITGTVTDDQMLGGMYIGLVRTDQDFADASVNATNTITLLHTHDFDTPTGHSFTASIVTGAAKDNDNPAKDITADLAWRNGNYYILVKAKDAFGGNWTYSAHYQIVINN